MLDRLDEKQFEQIAGYIESKVGIRLPSTKRSMVEGRLRRRVRALGLANLNEYARSLFEDGGLLNESTHLIDCVATNKTDFFREPDHFAFLAQEAAPRLLEERRSARALKIWSAACSIGAEAYTLAMVLADLAAAEPFSFKILGTDISTAALAEARLAIYSEKMLAPVPEEMRRRYVMRCRDPMRPEGRIVPELRRNVRFERLNLMNQTYPIDRDIDVIFCRNVLIYFTRETQMAVFCKLCQHLRVGGYLFLGHSESMASCRLSPLQQITPTVFRRKKDHPCAHREKFASSSSTTLLQ